MLTYLVLYTVLSYLRKVNMTITLNFKTMKSYTVYVNTEGRKFFPAQWEAVGNVTAKNKAEAIRMVYDAAWGVDNSAQITADGSTLQHVNKGASFTCEIN